jgi:mitochondrial import receptor subunit TOM40
MGVSISRAEPVVVPPKTTATAPPGVTPPNFLPPSAAAIVQQQQQAATKQKVDYNNLPQPVRYEELQREVMMSLKPDLFEGLKFDFNKPLNMNFSVSHSILLGNVELPQEYVMVPQGFLPTAKASLGRYEFGANLISNKGNMMIGRLSDQGQLSGRVKYDVTDWMSTKLQLNLSPEEGNSHAMLDVGLKGKDWNSEAKFGNGGFYGWNYLQSVTPHLALGGEIFYLSQQRKSGVGWALRHATDKHVATAQVATTGLVALTYVHKVSEKASIATDLMWNWKVREPTASVGYDYLLRQCRLRGRIDSQGKIGAYLEERLNPGVTFVLSAELDHWKKDYKFGFGLTVGE